MRLTPSGLPGLKNRSIPLGLEEKLRVGGDLPQCAAPATSIHEVLPRAVPMARNLVEALQELADKGQIDRFQKKALRFLRGEREPTQPQPRDKECSTKVVATIAGGYAEGMTQLACNAHLRACNSAIVRRILIDTGSSMDIITWDYLKKLTYLGRDIVPLVHPILGFGGQ
ncbi:hypothetical protein Cgig2_030552 [Carnegiea gigantea]|uniref:Peptidase A2 domain-containing protein n=1 Tax=Carnegiea gigantea TaxID=171969 RepID=A0A9Q1JN16_9CARY|nr:hypothetical protein Cgig2_030552 [Carnegiea gigantea]